jgi:hypothetical protein
MTVVRTGAISRFPWNEIHPMFAIPRSANEHAVSAGDTVSNPTFSAEWMGHPAGGAPGIEFKSQRKHPD